MLVLSLDSLNKAKPNNRGKHWATFYLAQPTGRNHAFDLVVFAFDVRHVDDVSADFLVSDGITFVLIAAD